MNTQRPPRLVATDLDGTLLRSDGTVSARTRAALSAAAAGGAEIVFVTARPPRAIAHIAEQVGHLGTAICVNGAVTYELARERIVGTRPVALDAATRMAETLAARLPGVGFAVETGIRVIAATGFGPRWDHDHRHVVVPTVSDVLRLAESIAKLFVWSADHHADPLLELARAAAAEHGECTHSGGSGLVEISAVGVSKASTLAAYCAARGIAPDEVVAFGDMPNDLDVLGWAGAAYAMANAHPAVLAATPRRAGTNDDDGVARVLERLFA
ncbi:hypothetical protein LX15_005810 [Streptoalloteichus tenebrarius]|uniref:Hydrolase n=1 Tax=Streptoalloteichus tenebrarius (strain ATCC 17920 / DSM 40477 / JCM 4838 / CBS 697.72 / NBRC 16177 / NCIMB 11028 / NRRL B-12390 / A12253. 1 / ISP 5477) TaxID=1933 RepID=A0ABT1I2R0_STRSD|nr:HAD family hydrolase [Streptoalloteichus tenebrarius]MCP2262078.1 hypothetical protein [Streptoalloteichus tenebrarius]BFF02232.1 HAD family hydrolase [Streptoalloteichus tenebrarius]